MTDTGKTLLGAPQRSSLFEKSKVPDLLPLAARAREALQTRDDASWHRFCDQAMSDLKTRVDHATLEKLDAMATELRESGRTKQEAREEFARRVIELAAQTPAALDLDGVKARIAELGDFRQAALKRGREIDERLVQLQREITQLDSVAERLNVQHKRVLEELSTELEQAERLRTDLFRTELLTAKADIGICVGYLTYPAVSGQIPIYPIIVCEFENADNFRADLLERMELAIDESGRYKLFTPGNESAPFAESDEPIDDHSHGEFQRLLKHWGYWFLRVQGALNQWDFQVIGDRAFALKTPIEESLYTLSQPREVLIAAAIKGSRHGDTAAVHLAAEKMCERMEALAGKLPVKRKGPANDPNTIRARVVHKNLKDAQATAQWVSLDVDKLQAQLKKIAGGSFVSVVWENVRTGVDFMQLVSQGEGNRGPDIWLRAKGGDRRRPIGHTKTVQALGKELPLWDFDPEYVASLHEEDLPSVLKFYQVSTERLRRAKAARIETSAEAPTTEVDKATHEAIVQNYLRLCQVIRIAAQGNDPNAQRVWPLLRDAVIFEMPTAAYTTLHGEFFRYCVRSAKVDPDIPLSEHAPKQRKRVLDMIGTGIDAPFPDKLPFRASFFAYGAGVQDDVNGELLELELRKKEGGDVPSSIGKLYGHLVTEAGVVIGFRHIDNDASGQEGVVFTFDRDPTSSKGLKWDRPHTMTPWIVNALVSYVNEHKRLVEQRPNGFAQQSLFKKMSKKLAMKPPVPPPFYVVFLKDEYVREHARQRASSIKRHIDWQHRWSVRGHDCVRFVRGSLPLDPELEKDLLARKYKVFTVEQPDSETFMALAKRGVPPKAADEWMAVLMYWRDSFVKGPADRPLIESVRRSEKSWGES